MEISYIVHWIQSRRCVINRDPRSMTHSTSNAWLTTHSSWLIRLVGSNITRIATSFFIDQQLHWLPVRQRVEFKLAVVVYKALNNLAPLYPSDECQHRAPSASIIRQFQAHCHLYQFTSWIRAFAAAGPRHWNSLPSTWFVLGHLPPQTENVFNCSRHQRLVTVAFRRCVQIFLLTYLRDHTNCKP